MAILDFELLQKVTTLLQKSSRTFMGSLVTSNEAAFFG